MGWGKFDDAYPHHPKLLEAGADGLALDVAAVCYANRYGTDGFIPEAMLPALYPPLKKPAKVAERLVQVGRWEDVDGGWMIHDFAEYNPTAAEAEERRQKRAAAGRKGGQRSKPPGSKPEANASPVASDADEAKRNPDPAPTPNTTPTGGETPSNVTAIDRETYSRKRGNELIAEGFDFPKDPTGGHRRVLELDQRMAPANERRGKAIAVISDYVQVITGDPITGDGRSHLARLVNVHGALAVFDAIAESVVRGAGIGERWRGDERALTKYVTSVLHGKAAS